MGEGLRLVAEHVCGRAGHGGARAQTSGPSHDVTLASSVVGLRTFRTAQLLRETARAASASIGMRTLASTLFFAAQKSPKFARLVSSTGHEAIFPPTRGSWDLAPCGRHVNYHASTRGPLLPRPERIGGFSWSNLTEKDDSEYFGDYDFDGSMWIGRLGRRVSPGGTSPACGAGLQSSFSTVSLADGRLVTTPFQNASGGAGTHTGHTRDTHGTHGSRR